MLNKQLLLITLLVIFIAGGLGSIYDPHLTVFAQFKSSIPFTHNQNKGEAKEVSDFWAGGVNKDIQYLNESIKAMSIKLDNVCAEQTNIRVKMAESAGVYGGIAGIIVQLFGWFGKGIFKRNGKK